MNIWTCMDTHVLRLSSKCVQMRVHTYAHLYACCRGAEQSDDKRRRVHGDELLQLTASHSRVSFCLNEYGLFPGQEPCHASCLRQSLVRIHLHCVSAWTDVGTHAYLYACNSPQCLNIRHAKSMMHVECMLNPGLFKLNTFT